LDRGAGSRAARAAPDGDRAVREAPTPAGALLAEYAEYLRVQRGLAAETVRCYCNTARAFLSDRERVAGDLALETLDIAAINEYLLRASQCRSVSSAKGARACRRPGPAIGGVGHRALATG
jgi:hypothetical protein